MSSQATHTGNEAGKEPQSKVSMNSSFWLVVILVCLFIAALNFIEVMGHSEEGKEGERTESAEARQDMAAPNHDVHPAQAVDMPKAADSAAAEKK